MDLWANMAGDFHGHVSAERYSVFRFGLRLNIMDMMVAKLVPGQWFLLDMRPPMALRPLIDEVKIALAALWPLVSSIIPELGLFLLLIDLWLKAPSTAPPSDIPSYDHMSYGSNTEVFTQKSINFTKVLDIGVGQVHYHDSYDGSTGGEMQSLLSAAPNSEFSQNYPEVYRFMNGPVRDADGFIDGTCNYYILVQLSNGAFALLFTDEQSYFSGRWRLVRYDDFQGLNFAIVADIQNDAAAAPPRRYNFNPAFYWDPFANGCVDLNSRLAVAAQVLLVSGSNGEIYSINFSWGTMDRTWRWRSLPAGVPSRYFDATASNGGEPIGLDQSPSIYPQTIRLREDMTMHLRGTRRKPDNTAELGRYYQRYLPASNTMPPALYGTRPQPYTHGWKYLPEAVFQAADQFSHFGVYADVNSRMQYYEVTSADTAALSAGQDTAWIDYAGALTTDGYDFGFEWLRNPWPPSVPPLKIQESNPSLFNANTLLRIVPRGNKWIAMMWDKRDDDLIQFNQAGVPVQLRKTPDGPAVTVTLGSCIRVSQPPAVQAAAFWFQPDGQAGIGFASNAWQNGLWGVWRLRMAALIPGQARGVVPLVNITKDQLTYSPQGDCYQYLWTPTPQERATLQTYCSDAGALTYGTTIWVEDVTGHAGVPDLVMWQRTPGVVLSSTPVSIPVSRPVRVTVAAQEAMTGAPVAGRVLVDGVDVGATNVPFTHQFVVTYQEPPDTSFSMGSTGAETTAAPVREPDPIPIYPKISVAMPGHANRNVPVTYFDGTAGATVVSCNIPSSLFVGQKCQVSVTMQNTGTVPWTRGGDNPYRLGAVGDLTMWGPTRVDLPVDQVLPGAQVTFQFEITAPTNIGQWDCQWRMLQELVEWFGPIATKPVATTNGEDALIISQNIPATMAPGGRYNLTVSVRNSGTVTWTRGGTNPFRLGLPYMWDIHTWGILTVDLPVDSVPPGADVSFSIPVTATTTLGTFNCRWQMEHGNGGWFGQVTPGGLVTIATGSASFPHASAGVGGGLL